MSQGKPAPNEQADGTRRLTVLYITALSAIALLTIAGQASVQWSLAQQRRASTVINVAGRQRMLSQKLTKTALLLAEAEPSAWDGLAANLEATTATWKRAHRALQFGDAELELPGRNSAAVQKLFGEITPHFEAMLAGKELVAAGDAQVGLARLLEHETFFLEKMDAIVDQYDREAQRDIARLTWQERLLLVTTLSVLLLEGLLIFRPAVARIRVTVEALSEAKRVAEEANAEKSRFLARMSHELRTPLNIILGLIDVQTTRLTSDSREHLLTMRDAAEGLLRLVDDLLEIGQWESGVAPALHLSPVSLVDLVARTVHMFELAAQQRNLQLSFRSDPSLPAFVETDAGRVQQLVINLVNNALKFTEVGSITVDLKWHAATADHGEVTLVVKDTGIGIPAADHQRIFESFVQLPNPQRRRPPGVGLGLNIVTRLVDALHGRVTVDSSEGHGSTFMVCLPMKVVAVAAPQTGARPIPVASRHVLVIEDAPENQLVCTELLKLLGHTCDIASTAAQGIKLATEGSYNAVLLDLELPDASGLDVVGQLRALPGKEEVLIAAVSAHALPEYRQAASDAGFSKFVSKPVRLDDLRELLGDAAGEVEATRDSASQPPDRWKSRPQLFQSLVRLYRAEWPQLSTQLAEAIAAQDAKKAHYLAHRIKGLTLNFDDGAAPKAAQQLEDLALQQDLKEAQVLLDELVASLQHLDAQLPALPIAKNAEA